MTNLIYTPESITKLEEHMTLIREKKNVAQLLDKSKILIKFVPKDVVVTKFNDTDLFFYAETSFRNSQVVNLRTNKPETFRAHFLIIKVGANKKAVLADKFIQNFIRNEKPMLDRLNSAFIELDEKTKKKVYLSEAVKPVTIYRAVSYDWMNKSQKSLLAMFGKHLLFSHRATVRAEKVAKIEQAKKAAEKTVAKTKKSADKISKSIKAVKK